MAKLYIKPKIITLRPRRKSDEEFLRLAYATTREEELNSVVLPSGFREAFLIHQFDAQQKHFETFFQNLDYQIVEFDGEPVGRFCLLWEDTSVHVVDITVITAFRGKKIGSALMEALVKEADAKGITASLMYDKLKPYMEKFYNRYGFKITKEYPTHFFMERPVSQTLLDTDSPSLMQPDQDR
jgi:ribosomal protein S18 acetylase RimI-like enzyme